MDSCEACREDEAPICEGWHFGELRLDNKRPPVAVFQRARIICAQGTGTITFLKLQSAANSNQRKS